MRGRRGGAIQKTASTAGMAQRKASHVRGRILKRAGKPGKLAGFFRFVPVPSRVADSHPILRGVLSSLVLLLLAFSLVPRSEAQIAVADAALPDAPDPQTPASSAIPKPRPCRRVTEPKGAVGASASSASGDMRPTPNPCVPKKENWYQRFADGPHDKPLTPRDKGWLAVRNIADPFNLITIGGEAGISVASDSHSPYGPGMPGYARYVRMSFAEDATGEFFGTFLIPSMAHQDPHYHRMEGASIPRRAAHTVLQVFWTQGDNGKGMLNYANLVGFAVDDEIANLYVPGRQTNAGASAQRYFIGLATAPIGNVVSEFLPDVASHIHVQIVILQRIINQVARNGAGGTEQ